MFLALSVFVAQDREVQMSIGLNLSLNWHLNIFILSVQQSISLKSRNLPFAGHDLGVPLSVNLVITMECGVIMIEKRHDLSFRFD